MIIFFHALYFLIITIIDLIVQVVAKVFCLYVEFPRAKNKILIHLARILYWYISESFWPLVAFIYDSCNGNEDKFLQYYSE